jgi:hypothetical protein
MTKSILYLIVGIDHINAAKGIGKMQISLDGI